MHPREIMKQFDDNCLDLLIDEIDFITYINHLSKKRTKITRLDFMEKYKLFENSYWEDDVISEDEKRKFNSHFSNLTIVNKLKSLEYVGNHFVDSPLDSEPQARTLMALKLVEPRLCYNSYSYEELEDLNRIQKLLSYKLGDVKEFVVDETTGKKRGKITKVKISYEDSEKIYNYYNREIDKYPIPIERIESKLQVENDNAFLLFTELCKFIRLVKEINQKKPPYTRMKKKELDQFFSSIKTCLMDIQLPVTRLNVLRLYQRLLVQFQDEYMINSMIRIMTITLAELVKRINIIIIEEVKNVKREIKSDINFIFHNQFSLSRSEQILFSFKVYKMKFPLKTIEEIQGEYLQMLIFNKEEDILKELKLLAKYKVDFKDVDIATFDRINKETEVIIENSL